MARHALKDVAGTALEPPLGLLLELTHRCPLRCPYCSNPLQLTLSSGELDTAIWLRVIDEAADLGVLQLHFSGGEPMARKDLPALVRRAAERGLYSNLITSAVLLDQRRMTALVDAGLDHIQISFQDVAPVSADRIAGYASGHARKLAASRMVRQAGLPLTLNFVVHRQNVERVTEMIALGQELDAARIEIAHVQYYGWGLLNRRSLLPTREQLDRATAAVESARMRLKGRLTIDYVVPDYFAINITPAGKALPCHAAETLPGLSFPSILDQSLASIWTESTAFSQYRGTAWMPSECRSCVRREIDWSGCRCQAYAFTGDAARADPACALSADHGLMSAALIESASAPRPLAYRGRAV